MERVKYQAEQFACLCGLRCVPLSNYKWDSYGQRDHCVPRWNVKSFAFEMQFAGRARDEKLSTAVGDSLRRTGAVQRFRWCNFLSRNCRFLERVFQQAPESAHSIFPADLFSLFVSAPPVANADFVDSQSTLCDLHCNLGLEPEPVFFDWNRLDDLAPENFVASFHVAQVDVGQTIGEQCQHPISHGVPEIKHTVGSRAQKPRTIHHVCLALNQRFEQ